MNNLDWLQDALGDFDDDYLIIDCPGSSIFIPHAGDQLFTERLPEKFRSNRALHPHPSPTASRPTSDNVNEHFTRFSLPPRISIHGGFG